MKYFFLSLSISLSIDVLCDQFSLAVAIVLKFVLQNVIPVEK